MAKSGGGAASWFLLPPTRAFHLSMHLIWTTDSRVQDPFKPSSNPWLPTRLHPNPMWRTKQGRGNFLPQDGLNSERYFPCASKCNVMHSISLPSTYSPPLSWSVIDIAYKRDDSRRRPTSAVLLHLGATVACLWRDKVVPFSFCVLRPIF